MKSTPYHFEYQSKDEHQKEYISQISTDKKELHTRKNYHPFAPFQKIETTIDTTSNAVIIAPKETE